MIYIENIYSNEVIDSRGNPTVEATVALNDGTTASAIVPSGASTGSREALELRDGDSKYFGGKGVLKACENVDTAIAEALIGSSPFDQGKIDGDLKLIDGSNDYSNLGANAILSVSMAVAKAAANSLKIPLFKYLGGASAKIMPTPMLNIINGGSHADNTVDFQEYMIMPLGFDCFKDALRASTEIYHTLHKLLKEAGHSTGVGDEGGFAPNLKSNEEPLEFIIKAIEKAGYKPKDQIGIALDVASSEFRNKDGLYNLAGENRLLNSEELIEMYKSLIAKYPIVSIEDGLGEDDWAGWAKLTSALGDRVQLVGDDLFVTNEAILKNAIEQNIANAVLIKPNQIGTVSQTIDTILLAKQHNYNCIMSHRSGESEDTFIADFAVGLNCGQIKTGSTSRSERIAKYNRLLHIEKDISNAKYLGWNLFE